jgi:exodeoxyribonuclease VII large subunit
VNRRRKPGHRTSRDASVDPITVSQLTARIRRALAEAVPEKLYVRGQISNFKPYRGSGHWYFTLKDAKSCIDCVMWASDAARVKFVPQDGMEMVADGTLDVYEPRGRYQLQVTRLRPLGQGALELAFQQMRRKLEGEGLFAPERKRPLPPYPMNVVLITSREAAALQDMLKVLRRYPWLRIMHYPAPVQGDGAASRIAEAIAHVNRHAAQLGAELIVLGRGGGSLEDLWAFNEESVARAMAASGLPIITGIGHEVDVSIADLIADHHAHTPTEAAQTVVTNWRGMPALLESSAQRLSRGIRVVMQEARQRLRSIERHEAFRRPLARIQSARQFLDDRQRALAMAMGERLVAGDLRLRELSARLDGRLPARIRATRDQLSVLQQGLTARVGHNLSRAGDRLSRLSALLGECHPRYRLRLRAQHLTSLAQRLDRAMETQCANRASRLDGLARQLNALSPDSALRRGFTLTLRKKDGKLLRNAAQIKPGDRLVTRFADGEVESIAEDPRQLPLFE